MIKASTSCNVMCFHYKTICHHCTHTNNDFWIMYVSFPSLTTHSLSYLRIPHIPNSVISLSSTSETNTATTRSTVTTTTTPLVISFVDFVLTFNGSPLTYNSAVSFSGALIVNLQSLPSISDVITLFTYQNYTGSFTSVEVTSETTSCHVIASLDYSSTILRLRIDDVICTDDSCQFRLFRFFFQ